MTAESPLSRSKCTSGYSGTICSPSARPRVCGIREAAKRYTELEVVRIRGTNRNSAVRTKGAKCTLGTAEHAPLGPAKRRRRTPETAESEILDAAERLIRRVPFRDLTIGRLMAATSLRRSSFYQYFRDVYDVLGRLAQRHVKFFLEKSQRFAGLDLLGEETAAIVHAGVVGNCKIHRKYRHFHRLLVQTSAIDPAVRRIYRSYIQELACNLAEHIKYAQSKGIATWLDPEETAFAMCLMTESYIFERIVVGRSTDIVKVADTLETIWDHIVYGEIPHRGARHDPKKA